MDTNLVLPLGVDKCAVVFDYYFADTSKKALTKNRASIKESEKVQEEDEAICDAVQRGLASRAYVAAARCVHGDAREQTFDPRPSPDLSYASETQAHTPKSIPRESLS